MRLVGFVRHQIVRNAFALGWVQVATFVLPLVTLPYLARTLGDTGFGLVVFAQSSSVVIGIVIDYGFEASKTREAAAARDDPHGLGRIVAGVLGARLGLSVVAALLALGAYLVVPKLHDHPDLLLLALVAAVAQGLSPGWFFIGIERLRLAAAVQFGARAVTAGLTFVLVRDRGDAWVVLALYAAASMASSGITTVAMYRLVPWLRPRVPSAVAALRSSATMFVATSANAMYSSASIVLLGLFASSAQVGYYGAADRVVRAVLQIVAPISFAVFPRIAYLLAEGRLERARQLARMLLVGLGAVGVACAVGVLVIAPVAVDLIFGPEFDPAVGVMRILSLGLVPVGLHATLLGGWLLARHMDRQVLRVTLVAGAVNLVLAVTLAPAFAAAGVAWAVVLAEVAAVSTSTVLVWRSERVPGAPRLLRPLVAGPGEGFR